MTRRTAAALAATLAVFTFVACGSDDNTQEPITASEVPVIEDSGGLPLADPDNVGDPPPVEGLCAPGESPCEDTPVVDAEVNDLPSTNSGMTVDRGLTISEALGGNATGVVAVNGHLYDEGAGPHLCERLIGLGERYGCEGSLIPVENLDIESLGTSVVIHNGLTYTEELLTLFGEIVDGTLIVDNLITG